MFKNYARLNTLLKHSSFIYGMILFAAIFGGGSIISLYGETCGLLFYDWNTWSRAFLTIGSPWCKGLNWIGYTTTCIVEHMWFHLIGVFVTWFVAYIPAGFKATTLGHDRTN